MEEEIIEIETEDTEQEIETEEDIIVVKPILQEKSVTPKKIIQEVKPDEQYNGLSKVIVEPYEAITGELTATSNGTYKAVEQGLDGFDIVNVETAGVDPSEIFNYEIAPAGNLSWTKIIKKLPNEIILTSGNIENFFNNLPSGVNIPLLKSKVPITRCNYAFRATTLNENNIKNIEKLDFSQCRSFLGFMCDIKSENENLPFPQNIDFSSATNINGMFSDSQFTGEISLRNTQNIVYMNSTFYNVPKLQKINRIDCSSVQDIGGCFSSNFQLTEIGGFQNLGQAYETSKSANYYDYSLRLRDCSNLTHESVINIFNDLFDIKSKGVKEQIINLHSQVKRNLTDKEIEIATNKGWKIQ